METSVISHSASSDARTGEPSQPIANYGLLADCNSAALVGTDGSIDWLCLPRFDSDAIFARLLDPDAGHWSIRPTLSYTATRRYLPGTLAIETVFTTEMGQVRLTDAMAFAEGQRRHDLGYDAPHELLRSVEGVSGEVEMRLELAPRPQYGLIMPLVRLEDGGARTFGAGRLSIRSAVSLELEGSTMHAVFTVGAGQRLGFCVRWAPPESQTAPEPTAAEDVAARIADTAEGWRSWEAEHDIYEGPHRDLVQMSSRVLKGLSYRPTGAIVAAPTTSLPETVGGERN
jgi:alpha,alpha-trehalase